MWATNAPLLELNAIGEGPKLLFRANCQDEQSQSLCSIIRTFMRTYEHNNKQATAFSLELCSWDINHHE